MPDVRQPRANAYLAGALVMLLAVLIGNLDTPRTFGQAVVRAGGWNGEDALIEERYLENVRDFEEEMGRPPTAEEIDDLQAEAESISDITVFNEWINSFEDGMKKVLDGESLPLASHRWYWAPTRVLSELPDGKGHNAIAEMPYFTFLYGDLHAHMIAMPMTLLVILFAINEMMTAGLGIRRRWGAFVALGVAAITAGLLRATNAWDWPTYMIVGIAGITFAAWVGQGRLNRQKPPSHLYLRLRQALDIRYVVNLWPILLAIPLMMVLRVGLHVISDANYEARLESGDIPAQCITHDANLDNPDIENDTLIEPPFCDDNLKPRISIPGILLWGGLGFAGGVFLYMAGLIVLGNRFNKDSLVDWVGGVIGFVAISIVAAWPFLQTYATPYNEILPWDKDKSPLWAYLTIHGVFIFLIASLLIWQTGRWLRRHKVTDLRGMGMPFLVVVGLVPLTLIVAVASITLLDYHSFIVSLPLFVWLSVMFLLPDQSNVERLVYAAAALALGLTIGVEVIVLEGDIGRQNTVFKFYIQAWLLFSIAGGVGLAWMLAAVNRWRGWLRGSWQTAVAGLLVVALLYPLMATQARLLDRMNADDTPLTLDGMDYMAVAPHSEEGIQFNLRGDYHMIRWLQQNVEDTPYIIEASFGLYRWAGRISIYTGLPTVLGWNWHQRQQRALGDLNNLVWNREANVQAFYETPSIETAWNLIEFYDINYIIVGTLERIVYGDIVNEGDALRTNASAGFQKFEDMVDLGLLEVPYRRAVCVHPDITDVSQCPPERLVEDIVYRVVEGADYNTPSVAGMVE